MGVESRMRAKHFTPWSVAAAGSLVLPAVLTAVLPDARWPALLLAAWAVAAAIVHTESVRRANRGLLARLADEQRRSWLHALSQQRHDWMNDLQILYGYLRLQKLHYAMETVDRIRERMERESRISRLGSNELAHFLLSFRAFSDTLRLDVRVDERFSMEGTEAERERIARAVIGLIDAVRFRAAQGAEVESTLRLDFRRCGEGLELQLDFDGETADDEGLRGEWEKALDGAGRIRAFWRHGGKDGKDGAGETGRKSERGEETRTGGKPRTDGEAVAGETASEDGPAAERGRARSGAGAPEAGPVWKQTGWSAVVVFPGRREAE